MTARQIIQKYIAFFTDNNRKHKQIANASLVPENDPTTLFTSSGMQPLVPYLLGEKHPQGMRLVNVQNCFRAQDIEEVGDNRHTTFFRMLGNWSLGDYFKKEQLSWFFEFLTKELKLDPGKLYVTVFEGNEHVAKDTESVAIWKELFSSAGLNPEERIFYYGVEKNWWSRSGPPSKMPAGEPGGPDSEVFYDFETPHNPQFGKSCHVNCDCGRYLEIGNSVFMQYRKQPDGTLALLPKPNVDFGGGLERLIAATEQQPDVFQTSLFAPIVKILETQTEQLYKNYARDMRIVIDHLTASVFISANTIKPSNKEQGYILRRLIRRGLDHFYALKEIAITPIIESIVRQYEESNPILVEKFEEIKNTILEEEQKYAHTRKEAKRFIEKKYKKFGDDLKGFVAISADDAFILYSTHGLSPTQIKSLGYTFDEQAFAKKMEEHQHLSRQGAKQKFSGGLADHEALTIKGHTATHLLQQALRDVLGTHVFQTGSNITTQRLRFDFGHSQKLSDEEIQKVETIVKDKIAEQLPVYFEMMPVDQAKKTGAIGLFDDKYSKQVKVYFIGGSTNSPRDAYSKEFCGGPHVENTKEITSFTIIKQERLGQGQMRLYAIVT